MKEIRVIGIIGRGYSGSTILNLLLGSHPDIFAGSEMERLVNYEPASCQICEESCIIWSDSNLGAVSRKSHLFYNTINSFVNKKVIIDASKRISHFIYRKKAPEEFDLVIVSLKKHPLRHVSSYLYNEFFRKNLRNTSLEFMRNYQEKNQETFLGRVEQILSQFHQFENIRNKFLKEHTNDGGIYLDVSYEDIVNDTPHLLQNILSTVGLEFRAEMLNYQKKSHHPLGGNKAAIHKAQRKEIRSTKDHRLNYYAQRGAIFMDNRYQEMLLPETIETIINNPKYVELAKILNYPLLPERDS